MDHPDKNVHATVPIDEVTIRGMALTEALYEILADKGVLTHMEVIARTRKLTAKIKTSLRRPS